MRPYSPLPPGVMGARPYSPSPSGSPGARPCSPYPQMVQGARPHSLLLPGGPGGEASLPSCPGVQGQGLAPLTPRGSRGKASLFLIPGGPGSKALLPARPPPEEASHLVKLSLPDIFHSFAENYGSPFLSIYKIYQKNSDFGK